MSLHDPPMYVHKIFPASAENALVEDVQRDSRYVYARKLLRAVLCVRQGVYHAVYASFGEGFHKFGVEVFADADELELPVELVVCHVAEESVEFAPPGLARKPERQHYPLCGLVHAG